jgi:hypothetical protein
VSESEQLAALARLGGLFDREGIDYWLFGGWAVDFYAGTVTRAHDDLDVAVRAENADRVRELLAGDGWRHVAEPDEAAGYAAYDRDGMRLEVAWVEPGDTAWPPGSFEDDRAELQGARVRLVSLHSLKADKAAARADPIVAAKDRADTAALSALLR